MVARPTVSRLRGDEGGGIESQRIVFKQFGEFPEFQSWSSHGQKNCRNDTKVIANLALTESGDAVLEPSAHAEPQAVLHMLRKISTQLGMEINSPDTAITPMNTTSGSRSPASPLQTKDIIKQPVKAKETPTSRRTRTFGTENVALNTKPPVPLSPVSIDDLKPVDIEPLPECKKMLTFKISDSEVVVKYLREKLILLQQQVCKKISKEWIRNIAPKKQATWPYTKSEQMPKWWPPVEQCKFKEPDHIDRDERVVLCVYLLRLRPSPDELIEWNKGKTPTNEIHVNEGWTAFLQACTQPSLFKGLAKEPAVKEQRRERLLSEMYRVTRMEEDYLNGACDGNAKVHWERELGDDVICKPRSSTKRARRSSGVGINDLPTGPRGGKGRHRSKRIKQDPEKRSPTESTGLVDQLSTVDLARRMTTHTDDSSDAGTGPLMVSDEEAWPSQVIDAKANFGSHAEDEMQFRQSFEPRGQVIPAAWTNDNFGREVPSHSVGGSTNESFSSTQCSQEEYRAAPQAVPVLQNYEMHDDTMIHHNVPLHHPLYVNYAPNVPAPRFDTVPNSPTIAPGEQCTVVEQPIDGQHAQAMPGVPYVIQYLPPSMASHSTAAVDNFSAASHSPISDSSGQYVQNSGMVPMQYFPTHPTAEVDQTQYNIQDMEYMQQGVQGLARPYQYEQHQQHPHGLPLMFTERRPDTNFSAGPLPGRVVRGFTGHKSGVGGGAWV